MPPPFVLNASVIDARMLYKLKDSVHYECMTGYLLVGNDAVVCRAGGQWSKVNFACKGMTLLILSDTYPLSIMDSDQRPD
jgi:hypothetical protein